MRIDMLTRAADRFWDMKGNPSVHNPRDYVTELRYAAGKLDLVSPEYWAKFRKGDRPFGIPFQIIQWGENNRDRPRRFTREAEMYVIFMGAKNFDGDHAEQCYRILQTYMDLRELNEEKNQLPAGF